MTDIQKQLAEALQGLDEAYCRAGTPLSKAERNEDRARLIAAQAALAAHRQQEARKPLTWQPIETAPKANGGLVDILIGDRRYAGCHYDSICDEYRHITACGALIRLRGATHWMPIPATPDAAHGIKGE